MHPTLSVQELIRAIRHQHGRCPGLAFVKMRGETVYVNGLRVINGELHADLLIPHDGEDRVLPPQQLIEVPNRNWI